MGDTIMQRVDSIGSGFNNSCEANLENIFAGFITILLNNFHYIFDQYFYNSLRCASIP